MFTIKIKEGLPSKPIMPKIRSICAKGIKVTFYPKKLFKYCCQSIVFNNLLCFRCEFLLQQKGPDFVHMVVDLFPNLRRPVLRNGFDVPPSVRSANLPAPVSVIDPQVCVRVIDKKI